MEKRIEEQKKKNHQKSQKIWEIQHKISSNKQVVSRLVSKNKEFSKDNQRLKEHGYVSIEQVKLAG